ncbi:MAG: peptidylprolyl isomerase [Thiohalophilus sp.]
MQISENKVVTIDYTLKDDSGNVLDSSQGGPGLAYLHGAGNIIPGLENALAGKSEGDSLNVSVQPDDAYGQRDDSMIQTVPKDMFEGTEVQVGAQYQAMTPEGQPLTITVMDIKDDGVVIDGNHPLAGQALHFDVTITEVREPTQEELDHGHVHGPGGHEHE